MILSPEYVGRKIYELAYPPRLICFRFHILHDAGSHPFEQRSSLFKRTRPRYCSKPPTLIRQPTRPARMDQPPQPLATSPIVQNGFPQSYTASFPSKAESPLLPKSSVQPGFTTFKLESETDQRRASTSSTIHKQRDIFWRPPTAMILSMVMGIGCSVALHCYYTSLDGTLVGNGDDQQRSLRIGTTLAFFAHVCLIYSIQKVFAQWLWRELKSHIISFQGIDAAFAATRDPLSFTNLEMLTKVRLASILALVSWWVPLMPSVIRL